MGSGKITSNAEIRSVATNSNVSPRSKTSRTLPLRNFLTPGRSTIDLRRFAFTIHRHGRISRQTPRANSAWARLGLFQRNPENFRRSGGRRCDLAQRRARSVDWERDLQFEIANRRAPIFAAAARPRFGFL